MSLLSSATAFPSLPASAGPTMALALALALLLTHASGASAIRTIPKARRALDDVRTKTLRVKSELELAEAVRQELGAMLQGMPPTDREAELAATVERTLDCLRALRTSFDACEHAARALDHSLVDAMRFDTLIDAVAPGWKKQSRALRPAITEFREMILADEMRARFNKAEQDTAAFFGRALAEAGLGEWGSDLPKEEEPLVDPDGGESLSWTPRTGWH